MESFHLGWKSRVKLIEMFYINPNNATLNLFDNIDINTLFILMVIHVAETSLVLGCDMVIDWLIDWWRKITEKRKIIRMMILLVLLYREEGKKHCSMNSNI